MDELRIEVTSGAGYREWYVVLNGTEKIGAYRSLADARDRILSLKEGN